MLAKMLNMRKQLEVDHQYHGIILYYTIGYNHILFEGNTRCISGSWF